MIACGTLPATQKHSLSPLNSYKKIVIYERWGNVFYSQCSHSWLKWKITLKRNGNVYSHNTMASVVHCLDFFDLLTAFVTHTHTHINLSLCPTIHHGDSEYVRFSARHTHIAIRWDADDVFGTIQRWKYLNYFDFWAVRKSDSLKSDKNGKKRNNRNV